MKTSQTTVKLQIKTSTKEKNYKLKHERRNHFLKKNSLVFCLKEKWETKKDRNARN